MSLLGSLWKLHNVAWYWLRWPNGRPTTTSTGEPWMIYDPVPSAVAEELRGGLFSVVSESPDGWCVVFTARGQMRIWRQAFDDAGAELVDKGHA